MAEKLSTIKLNLALAGIGGKDEIVELPAAQADELVEMGHADPVVDGEPVVRESVKDGDGELIVDPDAGKTDDELAAERAARDAADAEPGVHQVEAEDDDADDDKPKTSRPRRPAAK
jgi:hypothetical protein